MRLVDTHCHIHSADYPLPIPEVDAHDLEVGVTDVVCVGVDAADSERAVRFVADRPNSWASVGQHPHEAKEGMKSLGRIRSLVVAERPPQPVTDHVASRPEEGARGAHQRQQKIVAIGECGLDYYYNYSSKKDQEKALRYQIELALECDLPLIFHVREAFDDFWPIFDSYRGVKGVLHSFTDSAAHLSKAVSRDLYIGVNGIMTFTKNPDQLEVARHIPLNRLVLETDAPFLTPAPLRGRVNEPAHVLLVATFLSDLRQLSLQEVAHHTTTNARQLFSF